MTSLPKAPRCGLQRGPRGPLAALLVLLAMLSLAAAPVRAADARPSGDPLDAPECRSALDALRLQEERAGVAGAGSPGAAAPRDAASAPGRAASAAQRSPLDEARRQAARACLGMHADPPPRGRMAQPPLAVPPAPASTPAAAGPSRPTPLPAPPIRVAPPVMVTGCDDVGCWASDGTRLQRVGPNLLGPRGFCTQQGAVLSCP